MPRLSELVVLRVIRLDARPQPCWHVEVDEQVLLRSDMRGPQGLRGVDHRS